MKTSRRDRLITDEGELVPTGFAPCSPLRAPRSALEPAFTRAELLVILAVLALLALVVLPALANNRPRSARVICANNLRQIGMAMQLWGSDHGDLPPQMVMTNDGGTRRHSLAPNTWLHFAWISNELVHPQLVLCPSDNGQPARDFTGDPTGGYLHPNFRNRATSYFLGYGGVDFDDARQIIAGDRNITTDGAGGCSYFNAADNIGVPPRPGIGQWTNGLHTGVGNVLSRDGRAAQFSNSALRDALLTGFTDAASKHIILPR